MLGNLLSVTSGHRPDDQSGAGEYHLILEGPDGHTHEYPLAAKCVCVRDGEPCDVTGLQPSDRLELHGRPAIKVVAWRT